MAWLVSARFVSGVSRVSPALLELVREATQHDFQTHLGWSLAPFFCFAGCWHESAALEDLQFVPSMTWLSRQEALSRAILRQVFQLV
jgi:hypothetical protein